MHRKSSVAAAETPARRPAHRLRNRLQEDRERQHRAEADAGHQRTGRNHDPAIVEPSGLGGHAFPRRCCAVVMRVRGWWLIRRPQAMWRRACLAYGYQAIVSCVVRVSVRDRFSSFVDDLRPDPHLRARQKHSFNVSPSRVVAASRSSPRIHRSDAPYRSRRGSRTGNGIRPRCGRSQSRRRTRRGWSNDG